MNMRANLRQKSFIQFHDEVNSTSQITLLANDNSAQVPVMSYLITRSDDDVAYFSQIQEPTRWLNQNSQKRYDPASLDAVQRIDRGEYGINAYFNLSQFYCAEILAEQQGVDAPISAPQTRPKAGSSHVLASSVDCLRFLSLPEGHSIGRAAGIRLADDAMLEIQINEEILRHHILSGGATGSGKSNTNVKIIQAAQGEDFCSLVYDMKPDYSEINLPNDEPMAVGSPAGIQNVEFWALGTADLRPNETAISVRASDLDPAKLAQVIFYRPGEELQQETAEQLISGYAELQNGHAWSKIDFHNWLMAFPDAPAAEHAMPFRVTFNKQTFNAVRSKINRPGRIPPWIDAGALAPGRVFGGAGRREEVAADQLFSRLMAGRVHVIRVRADADGRSYALFLDYAMRKVAHMRREQSETTPPMMHLIDEVADIFKSSNRRLALAMEGTVNEQIRKGRSLSIGFVLSAQSAGDIPEPIRHNLNSVIVFRHSQPKVLQEILPIMSDAVRDMASKLQPGEALVSLFKAHGLHRCRMHQSPARLFKPGRRTTPATKSAAKKMPIV
jgi:Helicase HerA, central domain